MALHSDKDRRKGLNVAPGEREKEHAAQTRVEKRTSPARESGSSASNPRLRLLGGKVHGFHDHAGTRRGAGGAEVDGQGWEERPPGLHVVADHGRILSVARHPKVRLF